MIDTLTKPHWVLAVDGGHTLTSADSVERVVERLPSRVGKELGEADAGPAATPASPHVLLVDDDGVTRLVARAVLLKAGYRITDALDGEAGLRAAATTPDLSLVVLDLGLPHVSGMDVLRSLRSGLATSALPIIVLTGSIDERMEVAVMEAGADDYVSKPLDPVRFMACVKATLRRAAQ